MGSIWMNWLSTLLILQLSWHSFGRPTENADYPCIESCETLGDGDYQSCDGCHLFVTCSSGATLLVACPLGEVWDDNHKSCETMSQTCDMDDTIEFMHMQNDMDKVSDYTQMPENFNLNFNIRDTDMVLNLTKSHHIRADFPIYMAENEVLKRVDTSEDEMFVMYGDKETSASFIVQKNTQDPEGESYLYEGLFSMDGGEYYLQPTPVLSSNVSGDFLAGPYMVRKMQSTQPNMEFGESEIRSVIDDLTKNQDAVLDQAQDNQALPRGVQKYEVEVLLFLDNAIYNKWFKLSKKRTSREREAEAVRNIRYYYSHVMNGVDMRYNSIEDHSMEIHFKLNAIYIAKTGSDSPWTEYNRRDYYYTEAYDSLDDFEAWLNEKRFTLPPFDLAALLTGYYLYNGQKSDGSLRTIGGLADIKGVCTYTPVFYGASISYENGIYGTTQTVTHEMGHNVGAYHDGNRIHAAECSGLDQYIMASAPGGITDRNYKNGLQFSHCSIRNINTYLTYLTMENRNCLLESGSYPTDGVNTHTPPGQTFSPDHQCQIIYGTNSYYCGGAPNDRTICREMWCYRTDTKRCVATAEQRAFEGTTCGNKKWCEKSDCVYNQRAPEAADFCIYGDYKDPYQPSGETCPQIIAKRPWNCYREDYGAECCESCGKIQDVTRKGCEYGDHSQCGDRESWHCYDRVTREDCCLFCDAFYNKEAVGCEYGNKGTQCDGIEDFHCYNQDDTCCATCAERKRDTAKPGCEYGDKQRWCRNIRRASECYNGNDNICCETCSKLKTNDPVCPYGDKNQNCRREYCTNRQYNSSCCETCRYKGGEQPPTVPQECTDTPNFSCHTLTRRDCYTQSEACCATCTPLKTQSQPGCEFGDKISWCGDYVRRNTVERACQSDYVRTECCESCNDNSPSIPTTDTDDMCPQGNKAYWCEPPNFFTGHCYSESTRDTCCSACLQGQTGPPGCEYGDQATWCPDYVSQDKATLCQREDVQRQCCKSCMGAETDRPMDHPDDGLSEDCPEGDQANWCQSLVFDHPGICYNSNNRAICCSSCAQYKTTSQGCVYGDRFTWCKPIHCEQDSSIRADCCQTCAYLL